MSLLVNQKDLISITVFYTVSTNKYGAKFVRVIDEEAAKKMLADEKTAGAVKTLDTKWKQPSWSAQQRLFADSAIYNPAKGERETDWSLFSDKQLKTNLIEWSLTDDDGRPIPVTDEYIDNLHASIANELLARYRRATMLEEGNGPNL